MRFFNALTLCAGLSASLLTATSISTPAFGKSVPILVPAPDDVVSRHISFADLNLAAERGQRALIHRVDYAVNDMCTEMAGGIDGVFMARTDQAKCTRASWDQARPQIDLAFQRAREIALTGKSSIAATTLIIAIPTDK